MFSSRPINYKLGGGGGGGGGLNLQAIKNSVPDYEKIRNTKTEIWTKFIVLQAVIIKHSLTKSSHLCENHGLARAQLSQSSWQGTAGPWGRGGGIRDSTQKHMGRLFQGSEWKTPNFLV